MMKQTQDQVGLALADDLVFRLFQMHVFGLRADCVGGRRCRPTESKEEAVWDNNAAASTRLGIVGPPQAAHGPLESSGRFQLHGHWRWWLRGLCYQRLMELCKQEPAVLESRLRDATAEAIRSIMSIQGSSVAQIPRAFRDVARPLEPLPLLGWRNIDFGGDGGFEQTTQGQTTLMKRPLMETMKRYPRDGSAEHATPQHPFKQPFDGN